MNKTIQCVFLAAVFLFSWWAADRITELKKEKERLSVELAHANIPMLRDTIHDSIEVVTQTVVEVVPRRLKEALAGQEQTIRDLRLKVKQLVVF